MHQCEILLSDYPFLYKSCSFSFQWAVEFGSITCIYNLSFCIILFCKYHYVTLITFRHMLELIHTTLSLFSTLSFCYGSLCPFPDSFRYTISLNFGFGFNLVVVITYQYLPHFLYFMHLFE